MEIDVILNELSLQPPAPEEYTARQRMSEFVRTLNKAQQEGLRGNLRAPDHFYVLELAPGYNLSQWFNDKQVDQVERSFLRLKATKSPFYTDISEVEERSQGYEFKIGTTQAEGCGVAYLLDALVISFRSDARWEVNTLSLSVIQLGETGNLIETAEELVHACCPAHIQENQSWIRERQQRSVLSGAELWLQRDVLFPSLVFCESIADQMYSLDQGEVMRIHVHKSLVLLETAGRSWSAGGFIPQTIQGNTSPESKPTLDRFAKERTFRCPDGQERVFEWHFKIAHRAWRIYFWWDNAQPGKLLIGYIGPHLPTVNDPT